MNNIPRDLIIKAAQGDEHAFEELYRQSAGFVYAVVFRVSGNKADADEITQDTFLKIYRNLKKFRFQSSFKTWAYRIAVNTAINALKKEKKEQGRRGDYDIALETTEAPADTSKQAMQTDSKDILMKLLETLSDDQRACIVLREIQGLDYKEIATTLSIKINTVRSRLKRAREALMHAGKKRGEYQ